MMASRPLLRPRRTAAGLLLIAAAACDSHPIQPVDSGPPGDTTTTSRSFVTLPVLGRGAVTGRFSGELTVRDGIAYTTTWGNRGGAVGNTFFIWDVAGNQPQLLDSVRVNGAATLGDIQVSDDGSLLVVAKEYMPGEILVYDRVDPRRPRLLSRFASANTQPGVHTAEVARVGDRLYAFLSVNLSGSVQEPFPARLVIVDLTDPGSPREVFSRPMGRPYVHDVFVRDGLLFTALWDDGMTVWDIGGGGRGGTPEAPVELYNIRTVNGNVHNIWWYHDQATGSRRYALVGEEQALSGFTSSGGDVHVVDLDARREVAIFSVPGAGTHNFWVDEQRGVLYAAYYNGGVRVLDIRGDLGSCTEAQRTQVRDHLTARDVALCDLAKMGREVGRALVDQSPASYVWGVQQVGNALYAIDMLNGLWKLDVTPLTRELGR